MGGWIVLRLRRIFLVFFCLCLFAVPARGETAEKYVALTFDDGPSGRFTRKLLDGLEERDVKATFLLCGYRIRSNPALTGRIYAQGHEIGYHGYTHDCMGNMCRERILQEIRDMDALLPEGCEPTFLRPPGGQMNATVRRAAEEAGLAILTWSVDPRDWATHDAVAVEKAVLSHVRDGDVILLHDMSDSSVEAALVIVDTLREQGYTFLTASQLAALRGTEPEPGVVYSRFP